MGIGGVTAAGGMSSMQMTAADLKDQKSKRIQNEITDVQQQIQRLSSKDDLSAEEKARERKKLQQEKSGLDTRLQQHQDELRRTHRRERMMAELLEETEPSEEEEKKEAADKIRPEETASDPANSRNTPEDGRQTAQPENVITRNGDGVVLLKEAMEQNRDSDIDTENTQPEAAKEMHAMVSADAFLQQADYQGTVITRSRDGIAVLKGEIKLDEIRNTDTERKKARLEQMENQNRRETEFQFSLLQEASDAMRPAAHSNGSARDQKPADTGNTFYVSGLHTAQDDRTEQPDFYVSIA